MGTASSGREVSQRSSELPRFSPRLFQLFGLWLEPWMRRRFDGVRIDREGLPHALPEGPLVVLSNHPSWWDPLVWMILGRRLLPGRPGYAPMDAAQLRRYGLMRLFGAFAVERGTHRGARRFLEVSRHVLREPEATLWIAAEGAFRDPRRRPVEIAGGVGHLVRHVPRATVLPLALEYTFWDQQRPQALARFGRPIRVSDGSALPARRWTRRFEQALEETMDLLARSATTRDASRFVTVLGARRDAFAVPRTATRAP